MNVKSKITKSFKNAKQKLLKTYVCNYMAQKDLQDKSSNTKYVQINP